MNYESQDFNEIEIKTIDNKVFRFENGIITKYENELTVNYDIEFEGKSEHRMSWFNLNNVISISCGKKRCDTSPIKPV